MAAIDAADAESCSTCHSTSGDLHQAVYDTAYDASNFELTIGTVTSDPAGADYTLAINFSINYMGAAFDVDPTSAAWVDGLLFQPSQWDDTAGMFVLVGGPYDPFSGITGPITNNGGGSYTLTSTVAYDIDAWDSGAIIGKLSDEEVSFPDGPTSHFSVYNELTFDAVEVGLGAMTWESDANASGCEACHGAPYRKHGNVQAKVEGAPEFTYCKSCHYDDRTGGHEDWQYMVDDPLNWANDVDPAPRAADYAYTANVMNDTHMSHALEFPYPQSMSNCNTCHAGKLTEVLDDSNFDLAFCKSCHVIEGTDAWPEDPVTGEPQLYAQPHRPPPMEYLWANSTIPGVHNVAMDCQNCHGTDGFSAFSDMHSGYDDHIYDDTGDKFANQYPVVIDNITMAGDLLTIEFSSDPAVIPELLVSFYGGDTRNFIVGSHERDSTDLCPGRHGDGCKMEYVPESSGGDPNPLFTEDAASVPGDWMVTLDTSALQLTKTDLIPVMIADGRIKKAEVSITPELVVDGEDVVLLAVGETYDIDGMMIVQNYFKGVNKTVDVDKCNACHDSLASTFHDGSGRGGDGIEVCKHCHTTTFPGSHLEMASRAIDSYVHAIHTFQPFDEGAVAEADDPVFDKRNAQHKSHTFPYFTALSCEGCHMDGTYNSPDQSKSMFGVQSASWAIADRNIGTIPESVTGPASRACGGCHRASMIKDDMAGDLASFDAHTDAFGTFEENDDDDLILFGIIDKIMSLFE